MRITVAQATIIGELMVSYGYNPAGRGGQNVSASFKARQALTTLGWEQGHANMGVNEAIKLVRERAALESENAMNALDLILAREQDEDDERGRAELEREAAWGHGPYPVA